MAGAYPDAPSRKMQHYRDGTLLFAFTSMIGNAPAGAFTEYTAGANHLELVDHDQAGAGAWDVQSGSTVGALLIFPELRDIDGTIINTSGPNSGSLQYSTDSRSGQDGTWTSVSGVIGTFGYGGTEIPGHRNNVYQWSANGVRAVAVAVSESSIDVEYLRSFEVFGEIAAGESPSRLLFIDDATALEYGKPQDYGDRPRGSAVDKSIRIKNNSGSLQANTIDVTRGDDESTQSSNTWYTVDNGGGFAASFQVASLGAGAEDTFVLRQNIPDSAVVGVYEAWLQFKATSWS